jgi:drug/metabolite transporter (DMT)-like permease
MVAASVFTMLRAMIIIITACMSIFFLKRKLYRHHWSSMGIITVGVFLVGLAVYLAQDSNSDTETSQTSPLGVGLLLLAQVFGAAMFISEERLLSNY